MVRWPRLRSASASARGTLDVAEAARSRSCRPGLLTRTLKLEPASELAQRSRGARRALLGRGISFPVALEGALKLKEISYIHAEGYAAGELKHGPIALIDEDPGDLIAPRDAMLPKMVTNVQEVAARAGDRADRERAAEVAAHIGITRDARDGRNSRRSSTPRPPALRVSHRGQRGGTSTSRATSPSR